MVMNCRCKIKLPLGFTVIFCFRFVMLRSAEIRMNYLQTCRRNILVTTREFVGFCFNYDDRRRLDQ